MDLGGFGWAFGAAGIGAGLAAIGAALGIGRLAGQAMDGIARQPASTADIRGLTIVTAAFVEGAALFAIVVCLLGMIFAGGKLPAGEDLIKYMGPGGELQTQYDVEKQRKADEEASK